MGKIRIAVVGLLLPMFCATSGLAASYCAEGEGLGPWYIADIPHGFAIVHKSAADYCSIPDKDDKRFPQRAALPYVCNGQSDFRLNFEMEGDKVILTTHDLEKTEFTRCQ